MPVFKAKKEQTGVAVRPSTMITAIHRLPQHSTFQPAAAYRPARRSGGNHQWPAWRRSAASLAGCSTNVAGRQSAPGFKAAVATMIRRRHGARMATFRFLHRWATPSVSSGNMPHAHASTPRPSCAAVCITMVSTTFRRLAAASHRPPRHRRLALAARRRHGNWSADSCHGTGSHGCLRWSRWSIA